MHDSKKEFISFRQEIHLSKEMRPKTKEHREKMRNIPYDSTVGSLMYAFLCTKHISIT